MVVVQCIMPSTITLIGLFLTAMGILYGLKTTLFHKRTSSHAPLPPGPKPKLIVGNLADLPPSGGHDYQHWLKHKELYGPISSVTVFGQNLIIVNDAQIAHELMEKRATLYSSRPRMVFAGEMVGAEKLIAMLPYSNRLRAYRKNIHGAIGSKSTAAQFNVLQVVEVRRFLLRVLEKPADLIQHLRKEAGAIILKLTYGYNIEPHKEDPLVNLIEKALGHLTRAVSPGAWLVDIIPARMLRLNNPHHKAC